MIIGTAGHIDHGKSALVEALTGARMDPLEEERRRGITIDLHFAPLALEGGQVAGVIDVPGHEDLIRTMVAGAAGIDLVLLIVAADEGIMPQTREHLAIVEQLRVPAGIPVITKRDLVEDEWLELLEAELAAWLSTSAVRFTPPVSTSATTGLGLDTLRAAIQAQVAATRRRDPNDLLRLPVDRALSLAGVGTVVTGTAWSGSVAVGDSVRLVPGRDEGRVRSVEHHGEGVGRSAPGARTAVGLSGIERSRVRRGQVLVRTGDPWRETTALDVALELLPSAPRPLQHHTRVRLNLGTDEVMARVTLQQPVAPGARATVRLSLERPLVARGGDRLVLRSYSPVTTIGGGWIVDPAPPRGRLLWPATLASLEPAERLRALAERRLTGVPLVEIPVLLGVAPDEVRATLDASGLMEADGMVVTSGAVEAARDRARAAVADWHSTHPAEAGMPLETLRHGLLRWGAASGIALAQLTGHREFIAEGGRIRSASFSPVRTAGAELMERVIARVEEGGLTPPTVAELAAELKAPGVADALKAAAQAGRLEAVERERFFSRTALAAYTEQLLTIGRAGPITPQALRDATGLSRKFLIPLLEWGDRTGLTIRSGDVRQLTPRARAG